MFAYLYHPDINPVIFQIWGPLAVRWYGLTYAISFIFGYLFIFMEIKKGKLNIKESELSDIVFGSFLGVLLGGRLGFVLFYDLAYHIKHPLHIFITWEGGMSFHGGLIGIAIAFIIYSLKNKKNFFDLADVYIVPSTLGIAFVRWANFVNGELWGKPTTLPWGVIFPDIPQQKWFSLSVPWVREFAAKSGLTVLPGQNMINLPRHPSQLYEGFLEGVVLFFILLILSRLKNKPRGLLFSVFILGYGVARFIVEFFREPDAYIGYLYGGWVTMGIILSTPMILLGGAGLIYFLKKNDRNVLWA